MGVGKRLGFGTKAKQHFLKSLDLQECIRPAEKREGLFTGTKLVCSLGPSSHSVDVLEGLLAAGMVAARIDLTWGGLDFHRATLAALNTVTLTTRADVEATADVWPVTYPHLHSMAEEGDTIYIGRYLGAGSDRASLYLTVRGVEGDDIVCEAQNGAVMDGLLTVFHMERSADSLLNLQNNLPLFSEYDRQAIAALGREFEVDYINLAYTRTREDVREARLFLDSLGLTSTRALAKVETRQGLLNFRGILAAADGIVISRWGAAAECMGQHRARRGPEKMALVQKQLVSHCNLLGKPVLITRVVDSMVTNPRPTRAEATDIANAVLDGVDGILLGAETLRGSYPVEAVATIAQICRVAESVFDHTSHYDHLMTAAEEMEDVVRTAASSMAGGAGGRSSAAALGHSGDGSGFGLRGAAAAHAAEVDDDMIPSSGVSPAGSSWDVQGLGSANGSKTGLANSFTNLRGLMQSSSYASLQAAYAEVHSFAMYGGAGTRSVAANLHTLKGGASGPGQGKSPLAPRDADLPFMNLLESLASSAVRAAGKVQADLIIVYTATGRTAQLVAKYRPPMPILTLVVPRLVSDGIRWRLEGKATARACQLTRGLLPMLATPGPNGDAVLEAAVIKAAMAGLVAPKHHVVVLQQIHNDLCVKQCWHGGDHSRGLALLQCSCCSMCLHGCSVHQIMSLDSSGRRIAGPRIARAARGIGIGPHTSAMYPKSPNPKTLARGVGTSTGDMVDSDADDDDGDAAAAGLFDEGLVPLLMGLPGDLQTSASMLYDDELARTISAAMKTSGAQAPVKEADVAALKPSIGVMSP
ncbi:Pyruvate/Phosphoenolpyruvate kinase-like domain-containing protein [Scenedesmus sp. NREL 46B-D3]|nr:Pyruvate/Phosphoenolpyruvate kinase-like domain-containing protein [Scenedesmus sp. NREL 46B-D3]